MIWMLIITFACFFVSLFAVIFLGVLGNRGEEFCMKKDIILVLFICSLVLLVDSFFTLLYYKNYDKILWHDATQVSVQIGKKMLILPIPQELQEKMKIDD